MLTAAIAMIELLLQAIHVQAPDMNCSLPAVCPQRSDTLGTCQERGLNPALSVPKTCAVHHSSTLLFVQAGKKKEILLVPTLGCR